MSDRRHRLRYTRRELLSSVLGWGAIGAASIQSGGCGILNTHWSGNLPFDGERIRPNHDAGHRLRLPIDQRFSGTSSEDTSQPPTEVECVIVGGGVAGLSAAYHLQKNGLDDFVVLELEDELGGTSRSTHYQSESFGSMEAPWGAHYLPMPGPNNQRLRDFLRECDALDENFEPHEQVLCRDPEERVWDSGTWQYGLLPMQDANDIDREQLHRFQTQMQSFAARRDSDGPPWFTLPTSMASMNAESMLLDQQSMAEWMQANDFTSPRLLWLVDHSCRDDYGLRSDQTSAWAGIFYFASRMVDPAHSDESAPLLTWPSGNGHLVQQLAKTIGDRRRTGQAILSMKGDPDGPLDLAGIDTATGQGNHWRANSVILAVPQFIACRLLPSEWSQTRSRMEAAKSFQYGSWLVANIVLKDRPPEPARTSMAWDNVRYQSESLGYVHAGHQTGRDHGGTVLTWYQALTTDDAALTRNELMRLTWAEIAEVVCSDLEVSHPGIRSLIERLDAMVWGHAMIQPIVGSIASPHRRQASQSIGNVHFASTDLSAMALFEEAFDHGHRAAQAVMK
ncbi:flavin monoamine oxidase family protein [Rhodopirellula halodulae]|uniref:flavin monoamine oxidase family protein n=1 Tax=Rhodopirellula halodulae TaxID=2894198 RepID=UPI001E4810D4|nr:FAD-dependent oxidoreductase [Rhodopirellula sp. JC737]MCC9656611.1 FAD-dependent oxidoreductase [Rhodopirellula sp. JC737]